MTLYRYLNILNKYFKAVFIYIYIIVKLAKMIKTVIIEYEI